MKPIKNYYYKGKKWVVSTYEYRGFKYSKEYKKDMLNFLGLKISKVIDNYHDKGIDKIIFEDKNHNTILIVDEKELNISITKIKKDIK